MISYLIFTVTAVLLFISFRAIRLVSHRSKTLERFYPMLVGVELGLWIAFIFWLVNYFFDTKSYYTELVLVLVVTSVVLLVWYYIKDVVAGFVFRIQHNPRVGQGLKSIEANGVIKSMAASQLFVEGEGKEVIRIPYSKLLGKSIRLDSGDSVSASEAILRIEHVKDQNYTDVERRIKLAMLQSPWCVPGKPVRVEFIPEPDRCIEVSLHLLDTSYMEAAKSKLQSLFKS